MSRLLIPAWERDRHKMSAFCKAQHKKNEGIVNEEKFAWNKLRRTKGGARKDPRLLRFLFTTRRESSKGCKTARVHFHYL